MLDFSDKEYNKIYQLFAKDGKLENRDYPFRSFLSKKINFLEIKKILERKFSNPFFPCGLYVHFPFCQSRCVFCKYCSVVISNKLSIDNYLDALEKELELYGVNFHNISLKNLFLGGGTPTLMNAKEARRLLDIISHFFKFYPDSQFTLEGTPETMKYNTLKIFHDFGFNRIAIGVQTLNNKILKKINRFHTVKDVFAAVNAARRAGFKYVGIDLMIGLPGESLQTYKETISKTILLSPDFIICYLFVPGRNTIIRPTTQLLDANFWEVIQFFRNSFARHKYHVSPVTENVRASKKGIPPRMLKNQNLIDSYNYRCSCLGIGWSAVSFFPDIIYHIGGNIYDYMENLKKGFPPIYDGFYCSKEDNKRQYVISQIIQSRALKKAEYYQVFKAKFNCDFPKEVEYLKKAGLISETKTRIKWHIDNGIMNHKNAFFHILKYWYAPKYIRQLMGQYNLS